MLERKKPVLVSSPSSLGLVFPSLLRQLVCGHGVLSPLPTYAGASSSPLRIASCLMTAVVCSLQGSHWTRKQMAVDLSYLIKR